jgi:hypothetical protein
VVAGKAYDHDYLPDVFCRSGSLLPVPHDDGARAERGGSGRSVGVLHGGRGRLGIILSGHGEDAIAARAAALAHVVLDEPCPPERLQAAVEDAATARRDRPQT